MTRARGGYRILGTFLACAAVVACMNFVQTPMLMCTMLALWLSGCLFISLLHRGPSGYTFMLASYTASFIGFQAIATPEQIFDIAVARGEEIILGSLCAVIVASLVFPTSAKPAINARIGSWMDDAVQWSRYVLGGHAGSEGKSARRASLAADLAQFDALITMARHDDPRHPQAHLQMQELRLRMLALLPVLGWIDDRLAALHAPCPPAGTKLPDDVASSIRALEGAIVRSATVELTNTRSKTAVCNMDIVDAIKTLDIGHGIIWRPEATRLGA